MSETIIDLFSCRRSQGCSPSPCHLKIISDYGPFTNYVTCLSLLFDNPPTHCNILAIILLKTYHNRLCNSNASADHLTNSLWTSPKGSLGFLEIPKVSSLFLCVLLGFLSSSSVGLNGVQSCFSEYICMYEYCKERILNKITK